MTGFKSKKTAALDEDGMYLVHQTVSYADNLGKSIVALGKQTVKDIEQLKAQPAQEPVAWVCEGCSSDEKHAIDYWQDDVDDIPIGTQLYTTPPQRPLVGLTDNEIKEIVGPWGDTPIKGYTRELIDKIEAKLKEKNNG
jgi:hypothetical protein